MLACPRCLTVEAVVKNGYFTRKSDEKRIQRYRCRGCRKNFSSQMCRIDYWQKKRRINQMVFRLLCSGVSQRRIAFLMRVKPDAVARRVERFGRIAEAHLGAYRENRPKASSVMIDEMESFEHTKCKPLTIPIAVEAKTRKVLALKVGQIRAKGPLAAISRRKYGPRPCERSACLDQVFLNMRQCVEDQALIASDKSPHYPPKIAVFFPNARHNATLSRRGCTVGQGELKRGGFDPLFTLNHTYAMVRDNLKRLTRRTWCTTKRRDRLERLIYLYAYFHNARLDNPRRVILRSSEVPIHNL